MEEPAIACQQLTRDFATVRAVDALSIDVPAGIVFGFLGPNGAGKTTTIRLLLGLLDPSAGRATVLGFDTRTQAEAIRSGVGALLEHPGLYERLSVYDNLDLYGRIWEMDRAERRSRIKELLVALDLWDRRGEVLGDWSRGMKQKVAVARAMLHRPRLIFFDEPTAGLDPVAATALRDDLADLARRDGVTVFLTTHNLAEAEKICDRVAVIRDGRLLATGHPDELRAAGAGPRAEVVCRPITPQLVERLRAMDEVAAVEANDEHLSIELNPNGDGDAKLAPLVRFLVEAGTEVEEVRRDRASLEEAFLSLVEERE